MRHYAFPTLLVALLTVGLLGLAGCGATGNSSNGGSYGADAGPWPQAPTRNTPATTTNPDQTPTVPVTVTLRGKAADEQELKLDIAQVELRYNDRWVTLVKREDIAKQETLPVRLASKGGFALLAKTSVQRRKYTYIRVQFTEKSVLARGEKEAALPLQVPQVAIAIGEWTPSDSRPNLITITLDGTKPEVTKTGASLSGEALSAKVVAATGGISGKLEPALPTARVDIYWGGSKTLFGSASPSAQDGTFTVSNLPAGAYRVEVTATGRDVTDAPKEPVLVEDKMVALKTIGVVEKAKE